ncbi:MAG: ferredoxin FdxA [Thiobacillus sp.]
MTYVVTESCIKCKYGDCVPVCPVDAFHEGPNFMVIDPEACIDCSLCVDECPAGAIFDASGLPAEYARYVAINAELTKAWPLVKDKPEPLPDADEWVDAKDKFKYLEMAETA